jgi:hypothetical protein
LTSNWVVSKSKLRAGPTPANALALNMIIHGERQGSSAYGDNPFIRQALLLGLIVQ